MQQVGDEIVGERLDQVLAVGVSGQVAQGREADGNVREHAGPSWRRRSLHRLAEVADAIDLRPLERRAAIQRSSGSRARSGAAKRHEVARGTRAYNLAGEGLGLGIGGHAELPLQRFGAIVVLAQRFAAAPGPRIGADQGALAELGKGVERHQPARRLYRSLMLAGFVLLCRQPLQDCADDVEHAIPLRRQPFLKGLGVDDEIGEKLTAIQVGRCLQLDPVSRSGELGKAVEVDLRSLDPTTGKIGDQAGCGARPQSLAQFQQAIAQAVPRLIRPLIRPQQVGEPLARHRTPFLRGEVGEQRTGLLRKFAEPAIIALDDQ